MCAPESITTLSAESEPWCDKNMPTKEGQYRHQSEAVSVLKRARREEVLQCKCESEGKTSKLYFACFFFFSSFFSRFSSLRFSTALYFGTWGWNFLPDASTCSLMALMRSFFSSLFF